MDGIAATKSIRTMEMISGGRVPIIACTAGVMDTEIESIRIAGIDGKTNTN